MQYREAAVVALGVGQLLIERRQPGFAIGQGGQTVEGAQLIKQGIRINTTLPSPTETPMMKSFQIEVNCHSNTTANAGAAIGNKMCR